jgi:predicted acyltransferase
MTEDPNLPRDGEALSEMDDEQPIVIHGPLQGGVGIAPEPSVQPRVRLHPDVVETPSEPVAAVPVQPAERPRLQAVDPWNPGGQGPTRQRASSLDALRGLFLILMTLGFTIHGNYFPEWMYHRQFPPPGNLADIAGISWRDLAYAAFLFTMAAALPITLSRRIESGETEISTMLAILRRFALLFVFALLIGHSNTYFTGYTQEARALALLGFFLMFAVFVRRRPDWNEKRFRIVNRTAWLAAIAFLAFSPLVYDSSFSPARRDDIIAGLAFAALSGSVVWYLTRERLNARLAVLALTVALYLASRSPGWVQDWWWSSPAPWLMRPSSLSLLAVVIPGTIAGDLLLRWMRSPRDDGGALGWHGVRLAALALLCAAITPLVVIGLYNRWVLATTQVTAGLCLAGAFLTLRPRRPGEHLVRQLYLWGVIWLLTGLFLDPAEGGIRKVPETLSYFFTVTGLTKLLLVSLVISVDILRKSAWARPLIDVGHNPMIAYVLYTVFLNSVLEMIPVMRPVLRGSPGEALLRTLLVTALVVVIVQAFTRRRVYWRT